MIKRCCSHSLDQIMCSLILLFSFIPFQHSHASQDCSLLLNQVNQHKTEEENLFIKKYEELSSAVARAYQDQYPDLEQEEIAQYYLHSILMALRSNYKADQEEFSRAIDPLFTDFLRKAHEAQIPKDKDVFELEEEANLPDFLIDQKSNPFVQVRQEQTTDLLMKFARKYLSQFQMQFFIYYFINGLTKDEIETLHGISSSQQYNCYHAIVRKLKDHFPLNDF